MTQYAEYDDVLEGKCPFGGNTLGGAQTSAPTLADWYPQRLRVEQLHRDGAAANPLSDEDYAHMRKVVGYTKRHLAQRPSGDDKDSAWRYSLMNWGHDPLK